MDIVLLLIGAVWLAIALMLVWGAGRVLFGVLWTRPPLPFFVMLQRQGLTFGQMEQAVGLDALTAAFRRCGDCAHRWDCGYDVADCPNAPLFRRARALA